MRKMKNSRSIWSALGAAVAVSVGVAGLNVVSATGGSASVFTPITPCRLVDTRSPLGQFDDPIGAKQTFTFDTTGPQGECTLPPGITGLTMNVTSVSASSTTFFTLYPTGSPQPNSSHLNPDPVLAVSANTTTVSLGTNSRFSLYNDAGTSHVLVDVLGYYSPVTP